MSHINNIPTHRFIINHAYYVFKAARRSPYFVPGTVAALSLVAFAGVRKAIIGGVYIDTVDLTNKVIIVTGASSGIGEATALALADMNAHVILACRNKLKGQAAAVRIQAATPRGKVDVLPLDLSDLDKVREFCDDFMELGLPLHALVLNAGVVYGPFVKTKTGMEEHFAVNHLGHFLLTNLLLNKLISAKGRVVSVTSQLYDQGRIQFDNLLFQKTPYSPRIAYANSKLANILFINELQNKVKGTGVDAFSVSPGLAKTEAGRHQTGVDLFFLKAMYFLFGKSSERAAQSVIKAIIAPELTGKGGAYVQNCKVVPLKKVAQDQGTAIKLWELSAKLAGLNRDFLTREPSQKVLRA